MKYFSNLNPSRNFTCVQLFWIYDRKSQILNWQLFQRQKKKKLSWNFFPTSVDTDYRGRKEKRKVIFKRDKSEKDWKEEIFHNMFEINSIWLSFIKQKAIYDPFGELNFSLVQLSLTGKTLYYGDNPSRAVFCRWLFASIETFSISLFFFDKSGKTTFNFWHSTCSNTGWRKWWRPSHLFI